MSRTCYRFFGCFLTLQENWLNKMAAQGYRLAAAGKLAYQFESCELAALVPVTICQSTLEKLKKEGRSREDG